MLSACANHCAHPTPATGYRPSRRPSIAHASQSLARAPLPRVTRCPFSPRNEARSPRANGFPRDAVVGAHARFLPFRRSLLLREGQSHPKGQEVTDEMIEKGGPPPPSPSVDEGQRAGALNGPSTGTSGKTCIRGLSSAHAASRSASPTRTPCITAESPESSRASRRRRLFPREATPLTTRTFCNAEMGAYGSARGVLEKRGGGRRPDCRSYTQSS